MTSSKYLYFRCNNPGCPNYGIELREKLSKFLKGFGSRYEIPIFYCNACFLMMEQYTRDND